MVENGCSPKFLKCYQFELFCLEIIFKQQI